MQTMKSDSFSKAQTRPLDILETERFAALPIPEPSNDSANFSATQLEGTSHRIAKDSSGSPVLLLQNNSNQRGARIHLEHLDIQHSVRCRVTSDKNTEEDTYTVARCID